MKKKKVIIISVILVMLFTIMPVQAVDTIKCGSLDGFPKPIALFIGNIVRAVQWVVPAILIVLGIVDFAKAVIQSDEQKMKESSKMFIKRIVYALMVFFVIALVQFVFGALFGAKGDSNLACISCFIGGKCDPGGTGEPDQANYSPNTKTTDVKVKDTSKNLTKITITNKKNTLKVSKSFNIKFKYTPTNTNQKGVKYTSSNKKVLTVNSSGKVTAKKKGTATITITSKKNKSIKASNKIKVVEEVNSNSDVAVSQGIVSGPVGVTNLHLNKFNQGKYPNVKMCKTGCSEATISSSGCSVSSYAAIYYQLKGEDPDLTTIAHTFCSEGAYICGQGGSGNAIAYSTKIANKFGIKRAKILAGYSGKTTFNKIVSELKLGHKILVSVQGSLAYNISGNGHYIALVSYNSDNKKVYVYNPNNNKNEGYKDKAYIETNVINHINTGMWSFTKA